MKKTTKVVMTLLILMALVISSGYVRAADDEPAGNNTAGGETQEDDPYKNIVWTDVSKVQFSVTSPNVNSSEGTLEEHQLHITGLDTEKASFYVYIQNGSVPKARYDIDGDPAGQVAVIDKAIENKGIALGNYTELQGDIYVTILEKQGNAMKEIIQGQKIERPSCNALGLRISVGFWQNSTDVQLYDPIFGDSTNSTENPRNVSIKIGRVTDTDILRAIQNNSSNALSNLLNYAKNSDAIHNAKLVKGDNSAIVPNLNLTDGAYYYVYMLAEEDGKYYPVEDVSLYQANITNTGTKNLYNYLDENFKWNLDDDDSENQGIQTRDGTISPDTKLPQTGEPYVIGVIAGALVIAGIFFANKVKKYKGL